MFAHTTFMYFFMSRRHFVNNAMCLPLHFKLPFNLAPFHIFRHYKRLAIAANGISHQISFSGGSDLCLCPEHLCGLLSYQSRGISIQPNQHGRLCDHKGNVIIRQTLAFLSTFYADFLQSRNVMLVQAFEVTFKGNITKTFLIFLSN